MDEDFQVGRDFLLVVGKNGFGVVGAQFQHHEVERPVLGEFGSFAQVFVDDQQRIQGAVAVVHEANGAARFADIEDLRPGQGQFQLLGPALGKRAVAVAQGKDVEGLVRRHRGLRGQQGRQEQQKQEQLFHSNGFFAKPS